MTWLGLKSNFLLLVIFIFRCINAPALSLTPSISSNKPFLMKGLLWRGMGILKERMKTNRGRGGVNLYAHSVKNCLIFQTANIIPSYKLRSSC